jgi:HupE / UreJ protein
MKAEQARSQLGRIAAVCIIVCALALTSRAAAHGVASGDAALVLDGSGARPWLFVWLGAKHMVTGYDHLLYLAGVVFFVRRAREVLGYATLFAVGHSVTLVGCVLTNTHGSESLVDAAIGASVVYKAAENLGAFAPPFPLRIPPRLAVLVFGLVHGVGLGAKLLSLRLPSEGLLVNLLSFNAGVELGQLVALGVLVGLVAAWRSWPGFERGARYVNRLAIAGGAALIAVHLAHFVARREGLASRREDVVAIPLGLGQELEYKVEMAEGRALSYKLRAQPSGAHSARIYYDLHGESSEDGREHRYRVEDGVAAADGNITAPFEGMHGFYLLNDSDGPVTVRIELAGSYLLAEEESHDSGLMGLWAQHSPSR